MLGEKADSLLKEPRIRSRAWERDSWEEMGQGAL